MPRVSFKAVWRRTESGSALLIAALAAMLLATSAALMLIETRSARLSAGETVRYAQARAQIEALLAEAMVRLDNGAPLPNQGLILTRGDGQVRRQDAGGLLDINAAEPPQLAQLIIAAGVPPDRAAILANRIADWRDEDNLRRVQGAEAPDYADAGLPTLGNRAFVAETEIIAVLGLDATLAACLTPSLTTYSGAPSLDPSAAPPMLRQALGLAPGAASKGAPLGRVIMLSAEAPISKHTVLRRSLWIRLTGDAQRPVFIHRAAEDLAPRDGVGPSLPCVSAETSS